MEVKGRALVVGGGVVGAAVALALARRGVAVELREAESELGLHASGGNSGILHTGFDSTPGTLETACILRGAALREEVLPALGVPVLRCGARMRGAPGRYPLNGVEARREGEDLVVPGEHVTDPVHVTLAYAAAAQRHGAVVRPGARVEGPGDVEGFDVVVNAAGVGAGAVAAALGDDSFATYPRKGEFFAFDVEPPSEILLPVPSPGTKGVLVFPTLDGRCVAGPTAVDLDGEDFSVRRDALAAVRDGAARLWPALEGAEPVFAWAGLRPAGRDGANYVLRRSEVVPGLVHAAAIRSTGLSAALGIAERVASLVAPDAREAPLRAGEVAAPDGPWWRRAPAARGLG